MGPLFQGNLAVGETLYQKNWPEILGVYIPFIRESLSFSVIPGIQTTLQTIQFFSLVEVVESPQTCKQFPLRNGNSPRFSIGYNGALVGCALTVFQPAVPFLPPALGALPFRSLKRRGKSGMLLGLVTVICLIIDFWIFVAIFLWQKWTSLTLFFGDCIALEGWNTPGTLWMPSSIQQGVSVHELA